MDDDGLSANFLHFGPNFHLTPNSNADFFVGPFVAYSSIDDPTFIDQSTRYDIDMDDDITFGLQLGLDVPVCPNGQCWTFHSGIKYFDLDLDATGPVGFDRDNFDLGLDPLVFTVGAAYRF